MLTYKNVVSNLWVVFKDHKNYKVFFNEVHAKMFCENVNNAHGDAK